MRGKRGNTICPCSHCARHFARQSMRETSEDWRESTNRLDAAQDLSSASRILIHGKARTAATEVTDSDKWIGLHGRLITYRRPREPKAGIGGMS